MTNRRERCPGLSNEMNNHITAEKNQRESYQNGGLEGHGREGGKGSSTLRTVL